MVADSVTIRDGVEALEFTDPVLTRDALAGYLAVFQLCHLLITNSSCCAFSASLFGRAAFAAPDIRYRQELSPAGENGLSIS